MKEKLAKLIDVKSIVTLAMTAALLALYCTSYGAVITYFFTHKGA